MGQSSLPVLNKVGISMRWEASFDNLINFKKTLLSDIFLKKFFDYIFEDKIIFIFYKFFFFKFEKFKKLKDVLKKKKKKLPIYCSKIWFLKYQQWIVVSTYIYVPKVFLKKSLKFKKIKINSNFSLSKFLINTRTDTSNFFYYKNII